MPIALKRSRLAFQKTERALLRLASERDAESVHSFRTSSRRLQTLLAEIVPQHNRSQKRLVKRLDRIRKRAGKVRDLDVQLAALRSLKVPQEPRRKTQLLQGLIELRAKHEKKLRKMLDKETLKEIEKRLKRASKEVRLDAGVDPLAVARKMVAQVARTGGPVTEDVLHHYRIAVKRARYAAEFAANTAEASQWIAQMKKLQDAVGNWHDWLTLTQTATKRLGEVNQSTLVAAIHNVTRSKFRQAVAALSASPASKPAPHVTGASQTALGSAPDTGRKSGTRNAELAASAHAA